MDDRASFEDPGAISEDGTANDVDEPDDMIVWAEFMRDRRKKMREKYPTTDSEVSVFGQASTSTKSHEPPESPSESRLSNERRKLTRCDSLTSSADSGQSSEIEADLWQWGSGGEEADPQLSGVRRERIESLLRDIYGSDENIIDVLDDVRYRVRRSSMARSGSLTSQRSLDYTVWRLEHFVTLSTTLQKLGFQGNDTLDAETMQVLDNRALRRLKMAYEQTISAVGHYLISEVRRKDRRLTEHSKHCLVMNAILQLTNPKGDEGEKMQFSVTPPPDGYLQWIEAMRAVLKLPGGLPSAFRKTMWTTIANQYIHGQIPLEWDKYKKLLLHDRLSPDEEYLAMQIDKDLHRTGCQGFCGENNERERHSLKRVLLAYARFRPSVGYCQGFNIIAAVILDVVDKDEEEGLKIMIYLIEHVLPPNYFANDLEALSVDLAVFQELVANFLPDLSTHLEKLRRQSLEERGANGGHEPPLTNLFTIQWFLTLFATCLTHEVTLRIWDCVFLYGSVILMKAALALLTKLEKYFLPVDSAFDFYSAMQLMQQRMAEGTLFGPEELIRDIFNGPEFDLRALRTKQEAIGIKSVRPSLKTFWSLSSENKQQSHRFGLSPRTRRMFSADQHTLGNRRGSIDAEMDLEKLKRKYEEALKLNHDAKVNSGRNAFLMQRVQSRRGSIFSSKDETPISMSLNVKNPFVFPKPGALSHAASVAGYEPHRTRNGSLVIPNQIVRSTSDEK